MQIQHPNVLNYSFDAYMYLIYASYLFVIEIERNCQYEKKTSKKIELSIHSLVILI